jgi:RNA polymerase sigma-70 factor (ECF subfamily)
MQLIEFKLKIIPLKDKLFRFANQLVGRKEEAEDIVQDTFLKLWDKRSHLDEIKNAENFAMKMVKNASIDALRKRKTIQFEELKSHIGNAFSPLDSLQESESMKQLNETIARLNKQQQFLIHLRDIEGYSYEEIAEISGLSVNTIRVNISRARKAIKVTVLKQEQNELGNH